MDWYRLRHTLGMYCHASGVKRAEYLRKHNVFEHVGEHCMVMFRKIPLYAKQISLGDNVWIASDVSLITHDVIHRMLNNCRDLSLKENIGKIVIGDNVFIGANTSILPNVHIGSNTIIGAGSVVNKDIGGGVFAGVPARYICSFEEYIDKRIGNSWKR